MRRSKIILICLLTLNVWLSASAEPLTLDSCLRLARENNATIRKAELEVERAEQVRMQAMTKFFPQVQATAVGYHSLKPIVDIGIDDIGNASVRDLLLTLYGNYGAALGLDNTFSLFQHGVTAGVSAIQPVFMGGKIVAGNKLAKLGVEAAELQAEIAERDLLEQVEESYWLVVGLQDKQRTLEHVTQLLDTVGRLVSSAVEAGLALENDRMQVEVKQAELNRQRIRLESGLRLARRALLQSIGAGRVDEAVLPLDVASLDGASEMLDVATLVEASEMLDGAALDGASEMLDGVALEGGTPEEKLLTLQSRAEELKRTMTIADALPKVVVGANYGYSKTDANFLRNGLGGWNGAVFAMVSVPITGWWETGHKIREQSIRVEQARVEQRDLTEKLALRSQQAYDQMKEAEMLVEQAEQFVKLTANRARLAEVGYRAGTVTISDVLNAQTELLQAENERTDAQITYRVSQRRYKDIANQ